MTHPNFGRPLSTHRGTFGAGGWLWYVGGILILAGIVNTVQGLRSMLGMVAVEAGSQPATFLDIALMGGGAFVIGALLLIVPVMRWRQTLQIFEGGLVASRLFGTREVPRAEVRSVDLISHRSRSGHHVEIAIHLANGSTLSMSGLERPEEAANLVGTFGQNLAPASAPAAGGPAPGGWRPPGAR